MPVCDASGDIGNSTSTPADVHTTTTTIGNDNTISVFSTSSGALTSPVQPTAKSNSANNKIIVGVGVAMGVVFGALTLFIVIKCRNAKKGAQGERDDSIPLYSSVDYESERQSFSSDSSFSEPALMGES
eukprot:m.916535 g.916535  ORF g.916535 m.916535 type:complete len:129 (-) comp23736_c0_seq1:90-476(-)